MNFSDDRRRQRFFSLTTLEKTAILILPKKGTEIEGEKKMDRKAMAQETLEILEQGYYDGPAGRVELGELPRASAESSRFFPAEERPALPPRRGEAEPTRLLLRGCSTVQAVLDLTRQGAERIGVLNFASAKNPGGGFLHGAMAQEESLAASGGLYPTLIRHEEYYHRNRTCGTMAYTDCAIYSPEVVFFRDQDFRLVDKPVTASVLTLPAVNLGQVLQKGEDPEEAKAMMKKRMARALELFAAMGDRTLVLGAYGCGVFRNDPREVARWWAELLAPADPGAEEDDPDLWGRFPLVVFAVKDQSRRGYCYRAFEEVFGHGAGLRD